MRISTSVKESTARVPDVACFLSTHLTTERRSTGIRRGTSMPTCADERDRSPQPTLLTH